MNLLAATMIASTFYLHSGDRVVFYGDSITEQRLYTTYVEAFVATRYPALNVVFFNRGWAGDSSWGGGGGVPEERVRRDVAPLRPSVVVVLLGMNDGGYVPFDRKIESVIHDWYPKVLDLLTRSGPSVRLTLARTSPWDDYAHHYDSAGKPPEPWAPWMGYNQVLQTYGLIAEREAKTRNATYVDFNEPLTSVLIKAKSQDPITAQQIIPDAIHPGPAGHLVMTGELLKAWNADPTVSSVSINATSGEVNAIRTTVTDLHGLSWTQLDESLPFALDVDDRSMQLVNHLTGFDESLNRQLLSVTGLEAGKYDVRIDGKTVAQYSSQALATGVNLAKLNTPMHQQAEQVFSLVHRRSEVDHFAWRTIQRDCGDLQHSKEAFTTLEKLVDSLRTEIQKTAQPKRHTFELKRV